MLITKKPDIHVLQLPEPAVLLGRL
jgi:hypothetical protein